MTWYRMFGASPWSGGATCPGGVFFQPPNCLASVGVWEAEKALALCKTCSAVAKTSLTSALIRKARDPVS